MVKPVLMTDDPVLRDAILVARADISKVFDKNGCMKPLSEIDPDTAVAIESIEIKAIFKGEGVNRKLIGREVHVVMRDKVVAVGKILDWFESQSNNQKVPR